jgi:hypothetical protein
VFPVLFLQAARWLGRSSGAEALYVRLANEPDGQLRMDAEILGAADRLVPLLRVDARIQPPNGGTVTTSLREVAPGRYSAIVPAQATGAHVATVMATSPGGALIGSVTRGIYRSGEDEYHRSGVDRDLLQAIAATSGGRYLAPNATAFDAPRRASFHQLRTAIALLVLLLFTGELTLPAALAAWRRRRRGADGLVWSDAA